MVVSAVVVILDLLQTLLSRQGAPPVERKLMWIKSTGDRPGNIILVWIHVSRSLLHMCIACSTKEIAVAAANKM